MIIFDGVSKPSIAYNPKNYLPIVIKRFPIELAKKENSRTKKVYKSKTAEVALSLLLTTSFTPGKYYVASLITNANTIDYPIAPSEGDPKNYGQLKTIGYTDSTQKYIQYTNTTTFNNDVTGRIKSTTTDFKDVYKSVLNNYYGTNGLMDSSTTYVDGKKNYSKKFKYLHDRFIHWDQNGNWSEFLLNNKMQVIKRTDYNEDNSLRSVTIYSHDEKGRIIKEENLNNSGEIRDIQLYSYAGNSKTFIENKRVDPQGKTESAIIRIKEGNKITQNAIFNGKIASSYIYEFNKDGTGYTKTYVDGKMTSFTITTRL